MKKFGITAVAAVAIASAFVAGERVQAAESTAKPGQAAEAKATKDIVDTAVGAGSFTTLVTAVKAAELVDTLKGEGPFTVFAPSDDAFKKIPAEKLQELLKPENKAKLAKVLTYHVVSGKVDAAAASKLTSAKTVEGGELKIKAENGSVMINNAKVVKADVHASNGVIHVIDTVLMPE